jgi:hypothetical protein
MILGSDKLRPTPQTILHAHVVSLPDKTIKLKDRALSNFEVEQIVKHDRKRYMLINFVGRNGATYLYNKSESRVIAKVNRKSIMEMDVEPTGFPMRHYEFV